MCLVLHAKQCACCCAAGGGCQPPGYSPTLASTAAADQLANTVTAAVCFAAASTLLLDRRLALQCQSHSKFCLNYSGCNGPTSGMPPHGANCTAAAISYKHCCWVCVRCCSAQAAVNGVSLRAHKPGHARAARTQRLLPLCCRKLTAPAIPAMLGCGTAPGWLLVARACPASAITRCCQAVLEADFKGRV